MVFRDRAHWYWLLAAKPPMELVSINNPPITIVLMIRQLKYYSVTNRCFVWGVNKKKIYTLVWLLIVKIAEENWSSNFGSQGKHLGHKCLRLPQYWRWWVCKWPPLISGPTLSTPSPKLPHLWYWFPPNDQPPHPHDQPLALRVLSPTFLRTYPYSYRLT